MEVDDFLTLQRICCIAIALLSQAYYGPIGVPKPFPAGKTM